MRKIIPVVAAGATALALAGGSYGFVALNDDKNVTLSVDGAATDVSTDASTVGEVLEKQGITVGAHDVVAPAVSAEVADGTRIAVQYGRHVKVNVDGRAKTVWTTATRVDQALAALRLDTRGAALSTSRSASIGREGLALNVATQKIVTLDAAGQKRQLKTTAQTVGQVLQAAKITVDADDKLSVKPTARVTDGAAFVYTKVDHRAVVKKQDISYDTDYQRTSRLKKGVTKVDTEGRTGERTRTYDEVRHNGKVASRKGVDSKVTEKPRTKVVLVGTKVTVKAPSSSKPDNEAKSSRSSKSKASKRSSSSSSSSKAPKVSSGSVWDRLAKCESGGNWHINTGNGFYGGLQFTKSTWKAFGGSGMPHKASRERQIAVAKKVKAGQGWGAWPGCTAKLGIR